MQTRIPEISPFRAQTRAGKPIIGHILKGSGLVVDGQERKPGGPLVTVHLLRSAFRNAAKCRPRIGPLSWPVGLVWDRERRATPGAGKKIQWRFSPARGQSRTLYRDRRRWEVGPHLTGVDRPDFDMDFGDGHFKVQALWQRPTLPGIPVSW